MTARILAENLGEPIVTPALIAWAAGVIDARGYLSDRPSSAADRRLPTLAVTLRHVEHRANPAIVQLCKMANVEPIVLSKKFNRSGCGQHCPEPHVHVTGDYARWIVGGIKAIVVLSACLPHLVVQRQEALKAIRDPSTGKWKALHVQAMANLGWPVDDVLRHEVTA